MVSASSLADALAAFAAAFSAFARSFLDIGSSSSSKSKLLTSPFFGLAVRVVVLVRDHDDGNDGVDGVDDDDGIDDDTGTNDNDDDLRNAVTPL